MPHISMIGRRSWGARFAFFLMYLALTLGGLTMVVPFLLMVSNAFKSQVDSQSYDDVIPRYWTDKKTLALKYLEQKTNYELPVFTRVARSTVPLLREAWDRYEPAQLEKTAEGVLAEANAAGSALDSPTLLRILRTQFIANDLYSRRQLDKNEAKVELLKPDNLQAVSSGSREAVVTLVRALVQKIDATMGLYRLPEPASPQEIDDYYAFVKTLPPTYTFLVDRGPQFGNPAQFGTHQVIFNYRKMLLAKYGTLKEIEKQYAMPLVDSEALMPPFEKWYERAYLPAYTNYIKEYMAFKDSLPVEHKMPVPTESSWVYRLNVKYAKVDAANQALGTSYASIEEAPFPLTRPAGPAPLAQEWEDIVRNDVPVWFIKADAAAKPAWESFLRERYLNDFTLYQQVHQETPYTRFADVPLPEELPLDDDTTIGEWSNFINNGLPIASVRLDTPEQRYRDYLADKFGTIEAVNHAYGTRYASFASIYLPSVRVAIGETYTKTGAVTWEFATRNFQTVANYLALHGRAFFNTAVYILLALLFTLTVNPITAYALSRFKLKATNKVLLFLLATMAFPAEIAMIPNFLILKELHLLNTFWALVLPGMANGFSIFLLKGMFDGLPQDLYEAAELDGAGEFTIFWRVTMPLVKPFLAYLSLGTFVGAYSAFAFAFLLCPDPKMWTIMVFLQQMDWASQPVKFAAFVLASIPTLIVFVAAQRIIMQGIVLPTEK